MEAFEGLGFIACECAQGSELMVAHDHELPDLIVLPPPADGFVAGEMLKATAAREFNGKVLLVGIAELRKAPDFSQGSTTNV